MKFSHEAQNGFLPKRGCADAQATLKMALQTSREHGQDTYILFVDLVKTFDSVNRKMLEEILRKYGVPESLIKVIGKMYKGVVTEMKLSKQSVSFKSTSRVKQGDIFASTLFLYVMKAVLDALDEKWDIPTHDLRWQPPTRLGVEKGKMTSVNWKNKGNSRDPLCG